LLAKNDEAVCVTDPVACIAGKHRSNRNHDLWEPSLLAMSDDAVCLTDPVACIAGKHRSHRFGGDL